MNRMAYSSKINVVIKVKVPSDLYPPRRGKKRPHPVAPPSDAILKNRGWANKINETLKTDKPIDKRSRDWVANLPVNQYF